MTFAPDAAPPPEWWFRAAIYEKPIRVICLVCVVVTWPISAPTYAIVQLLASLTRKPIIVRRDKFLRKSIFFLLGSNNLRQTSSAP
jgi:hypothetical protein